LPCIFRSKALCSRLTIALALLVIAHRLRVGADLAALDAPVRNGAVAATQTQQLDCNDDFVGNKVVLDAIQVAKPTTASNDLRIACFIMTHSGNHDTRVRSVLSTWGKRCDHLLVASNVTDDAIGAVAIDAKATWKNLWKKLQKTLQHLWETYHDDDDVQWFLKADDDSYIIMENLKSFLAQQTRTATMTSQPLIYGRHFGIPMSKMKSDIGDANYIRRMQQRFQWDPASTIFRFPSGGSSYVFNKPYLKLLIDGIRNPSTFDVVPKAKPPEDLSQALVAYEQSNGTVEVSTTRDPAERFHMFSPRDMYTLEKWQDARTWVHRFAPDGIVAGRGCCSPHSISFHQIDRVEGLMQYMDRQLYECRK